MATVRKITSKVVLTKKDKPQVSVVENFDADNLEVEAETPTNTKNDKTQGGLKKRGCFFCETKKNPIYWDVATLKRYLNDRGRITGRARVGTCSKHQRRVSREIKHARHLAMLPFIVKV